MDTKDANSVTDASSSVHDALREVLPKKEEHAALLAMLQTIDERLTAAGVPYWVNSGTLIGAVRHGGFIPHDDDLDIELLESDLPRAVDALGSVGRSFRSAGMWKENVPVGRFYFWGDGSCTRSVDVFLRSEPLQPIDEFPSHSETFPLQRLPFHNITVLAPRDPNPALTRHYGPDWATEAVVWSHSSRRLLRLPLRTYQDAVAAVGWVEPHAQATGTESLARVGLESEGELKDILWTQLGWLSPYHAGIGELGNEGYDDVSLEILELERRLFPLSPRLSRALADGALEALRRETGAFLSIQLSNVEGAAAHPALQACTTSEDLDMIAARLDALRDQVHRASTLA